MRGAAAQAHAFVSLASQLESEPQEPAAPGSRYIQVTSNLASGSPGTGHAHFPGQLEEAGSDFAAPRKQVERWHPAVESD